MSKYQQGYAAVLKTASLPRRAAESVLRSVEEHPLLTGGGLLGLAGGAAGYAAAPEEHQTAGAGGGALAGILAGVLAGRSPTLLRKVREGQGHLGTQKGHDLTVMNQALDNRSRDPMTRGGVPFLDDDARTAHRGEYYGGPLWKYPDKGTSEFTSPVYRQHDNGREFFLQLNTGSRDVANRHAPLVLSGNRHGLDPELAMEQLKDHAQRYMNVSELPDEAAVLERLRQLAIRPSENPAERDVTRAVREFRAQAEPYERGNVVNRAEWKEGLPRDAAAAFLNKHPSSNDPGGMVARYYQGRPPHEEYVDTVKRLRKGNYGLPYDDTTSWEYNLIEPMREEAEEKARAQLAAFLKTYNPDAG